MSTLTITARGQVTFRKDILQHLGLSPGDRIAVEKMPDGRIVLKAAWPAGHISDIFGMLAGRTDKVATLEEIDEAVEAGWAGER